MTCEAEATTLPISQATSPTATRPSSGPPMPAKRVRPPGMSPSLDSSNGRSFLRGAGRAASTVASASALRTTPGPPGCIARMARVDRSVGTPARNWRGAHSRPLLVGAAARAPPPTVSGQRAVSAA